ncbi:MAG TPA: hypothetical protein VMW46_10105 [Candidatus Desulfaltia sp.]|nr:hypothetical protein [Candidatus Desulfaltia sp.]
MKRQVLILTVLSLLLIAFGQAGTLIGSDSLEEKIQKASSLLLDSEKSEDKDQGFLLLVESIDIAAAGGGFPATFQNEIREALEMFRRGSILDQQGGDKLRKAYALLNSGKLFQMPAEISSIQEAVEYGRKQISLALSQVKAGRTADAVKPLLETVLMVITPMEAKGE